MDWKALRHKIWRDVRQAFTFRFLVTLSTLVLLFALCYISPYPGKLLMHLIARPTYCFTIPHGVSFWAADTVCPDQPTMEDETEKFLGRMSARRELVRGVDVLYIDKEVHVLWWAILGLAINPHLVIINYNGFNFNDLVTYSHELGHIILLRTWHNPSALHYAYQACPTEYRMDIDACELLYAAETIEISSPMLRKKNRFRIAFE